jgi:hypothetical protein
MRKRLRKHIREKTLLIGYERGLKQEKRFGNEKLLLEINELIIER